jgi:hypothetical protein
MALLILAGLPACKSPAGPGLAPGQPGGVAVVPAPEPLPARPPYIAYRPAFSRLFRPKAFTLSNYAGANYPSVAPGAALSPTDFRVLTGH